MLHLVVRKTEADNLALYAGCRMVASEYRNKAAYGLWQEDFYIYETLKSYNQNEVRSCSNSIPDWKFTLIKSLNNITLN